MSAGGYSRFIRVFIVKLSALCDSRADETSLKATEPKTKRNQEVRGLKAVTLREVQDTVIILCDFVSIGNSFHMVLFVHINMWRTAASTLGWRFYINAFTETVVILSDLDNFHPVFFWNSNVTEHLRGLVSQKHTHTHTKCQTAQHPFKTAVDLLNPLRHCALSPLNENINIFWQVPHKVNY